MMPSEVQKRTFQSLRDEAVRQSEADSERAEKYMREGLRHKSSLETAKKQIFACEVTLSLQVDRKVEKQFLIDKLMDQDIILNFWQTKMTGGSAFDRGVQRNRAETLLLNYPEFNKELSPTPAEAADRPRFAALNLYRLTTSSRPIGMESYGPISLVLEPQLKWFSTVTFDDTNLLAGGADEDNLPPVGTFDSLDHLLVELHDVRSDLIPKSWESWCRNLVRVARGRRVSGYNKYWEAQIHAPINLKDDVVFVRASYQNLFGKEVGGKVQAWARRNGWPLIWGYKSNVLVDPTVKPESNVSHTDEWRWAHVFTSKRQLASAIRIFEENWKNCATEKMNIDGNEELFPQEKTREYEDFLKARWAGFWGDMPTGLRAEPATGADRESLPGTLHRMRLKPAA